MYNISDPVKYINQERKKALIRNGLVDGQTNDKQIYIGTKSIKFDDFNFIDNIKETKSKTVTLDEKPITKNTVYNLAKQTLQERNVTNITPQQLAALGYSQMLWESSLGTKGRAVKTNNPANVGNTETTTKFFENKEEGIKAYYDFLFENGYLSQDKNVDALFESSIANRNGNYYVGNDNPEGYTKKVKQSYDEFLKDFENIEKRQTGGKLLDINSKEYKDLYNSGKLTTYDKNTNTYIAPPLKELTVSSKKPRYMQLLEEEENKLTPTKFIDTYLPPYSRGLGISETNLGGNTQRYKQLLEDRVAERLLKENLIKSDYDMLPSKYADRVKFGQQYTNKELDLISNSKYRKQGQRLTDALSANNSDIVQKDNSVLFVLTNPEKLSIASKGTAAKTKISHRLPSKLEDVGEYVDMLSPLAIVGDMASELGQTPKYIKDGNYLSASKAILAPVVAGTLSGISKSKNTTTSQSKIPYTLNAEEMEKKVNEKLNEGLNIKKNPNLKLSVKAREEDGKILLDTYIDGKQAGKIELHKYGNKGFQKEEEYPTLLYVGNDNLKGVGGEFGQAINGTIKSANQRLYSSTTHTADFLDKSGGRSRYLQDYLRGRVEVENPDLHKLWITKANKIKKENPNITKEETMKLLKNDIGLSPNGIKFIYKTLFPASVGTLYMDNEYKGE